MAAHGRVGIGTAGWAWSDTVRLGMARRARFVLASYGAARFKNGVLMIDDVLEEARDESSILHKHFEWDDSEAADQYRRQQARALIQKCRIQLVETEAVQIRAFVSLPTDRNAGGGYRLTSEVVSDASMKEELLHDIRLTISRWTRKLHLLDQDIADLLIEVETRIKQQPEDRAAA